MSATSKIAQGLDVMLAAAFEAPDDETEDEPAEP
jgi:hypothetical protein